MSRQFQLNSASFLVDQAQSITQGIPLAEETGLGELTISGFVREVTHRFADREALAQLESDGSLVRWSYDELWQRSVAVAKALIACGLGKGERVGILMTNRAEFLSCVFGTALAGGVATLLSTFSTASELEHLLASSCCSVLLIERHVLRKDFARMLSDLDQAFGAATSERLFSQKLPYLQRVAMVDCDAPWGAWQGWHSFLATGAEVPNPVIDARAAAVRPADPAILIYSSGSTSRPKGILSAHRGVAIQLWRTGRQQGLGDDVRSWTPNGLTWSGNFSMLLGGTLSSGGSLVLQKTFDPEQALALIEKEQVNFLWAWPHQWEKLTSARNWESVDLSALKYVDVDCPIARHPTVSSSWHEGRHCYGNTETFTLLTAYPANTGRDETAGSNGLPLPGNRVKIIDPRTGKVVPVGERGEIAVKGPTLMLGYVGIPAEQTFDDEGYFRTGDAGYLDEAGRLFWEGRIGDIIKTGGANVSPLEVNEVIRECPGVKIAQTVGVPHATLGELVVTCVVPQAGALLDENMIRAFAREKLASYKVPRRVLFFNENDLRLTGSAKIKTSDLRELAASALTENAN